MSPFPNSVKKSFAMVMVVLVLVTAIPIFLFANRELTNAKESASEVMKNAVTLQASHMARWIDITMEEIRAISGISSVSSRNLQAMAVDFKTIVTDRTDIMDMVYVDRTGKPSVRSSAGVVDFTDLSVTDRDYFHAAMEGRESISSVLISKATGDPIIIFSIPMRDRQDEFDGLIFGSVGISHLSNLLSKQRFGSGGTFQLFDGKGCPLGNDSTSYEPHNHPNFDADKVRDKGELILDNDDSDTLTYVMPIAGSDLFVGGSMPLGEIRSGAARLVKATTTALALLSLIGLALFLSLTRKISRSLDTLTESLSSVAEGDYSPMESSGLAPLPKELRDIGEAIEYLKEQVRTSIEEIREQGIRDSLTGLHNRRFFEETIRELGKGQMDPVTVVMCDVNGLKLINDGMGHKWGDRLIERAKEVLLEIAGEKDTVARIGGDEFAVIMPQNDGSGVDLRFRDAMASANSEGSDIPLHMAWGTASGNAASRSIDEIVKDADERMYALKEIQREDARGGILKFFLNTIKSRESRRTSHMDRCRSIMDRFLKTVPEVDGPFRKRMVRLAAIHDIGLIGVNSEILAKKAPLSDEEMREVRSHPEIGYRIAFAVPNLSDLADAILHHHQRWDGQGYPLRKSPVSGEEIPLESRIMSLVDSYEAMTHREYAPVLSHSEAIEEIRACAGAQFDPIWAERFASFLETWQPEN